MTDPFHPQSRDRFVARLITEPAAHRRPGLGSYERGLVALIEEALAPASTMEQPAPALPPVTVAGRTYRIQEDEP